jgi:hypothetical protein
MIDCERGEHEYNEDGECRCGLLTSGAFWRRIADGLGMTAPPDGTYCLRLRPGKEPEFIAPQAPSKEQVT